MDDTIEVVDYDPSWPRLYLSERDSIAQALGIAPDSFQHIGSTAVEGLAAKPTIDLMIGAEPLAVGEAQLKAMERLGYAHLGEFGIPGRQFFKKGEPRTHHVHWVRREADFWMKQLVFRDYLRACPEARAPYVQLKRDLASQFAHDRAAYTRGKGELIARMQERAWRWAGAALLVFDLEATCWEGGQSVERMETIEIGAVRLDAELKAAGEHSAFVRPKDQPRLSDFCVSLTSISQADVDSAPAFPQALQAFAHWAGKGAFRLASWGDYDLAQLKVDSARHGVTFPAALESYIDLREAYSRLRGVPPCPMSEALKREGLEAKGRAHRAIDDARNAAGLARLMIEASR